MPKPLEMIGLKFGRLTVLKEEQAGATGRHPKWRCSCDCGNECVRSATAIRFGREPSCGCATKNFFNQKNNLIKKRFGMLTVESVEENRSKKRSILWVCKCDCGNKIIVESTALKNGKTQSCGCLQRKNISDRNMKHGHSSKGKLSPTYISWASMLTRCNNENATNYRHYGGRKILVCDRWKVFENFLQDMGERPEKTSIDRINVNGNYEPNNCRWATQLTQNLNKRKSK